MIYINYHQQSGSLKNSMMIIQKPSRSSSIQYRRLLHPNSVLMNDFHAAHRTIWPMILGAIRVDSLVESEEPTTPLPP
jgi:hypothetical protein